jgi:predicted alpha/beta superfamily hydrolase
LRAELLELSKEHSSLTAKKEEILSNIATLQKQAEESSNAIYEKSYELANEKMSQAAETMSKKYRDMEEVAKNEYKAMLEDCVSSFQ